MLILQSRKLLCLGTAMAAVLVASAAQADAVAGAAATAAADPQSTSANEAGQANDKQSLTTADIMVMGSKAAQAAPITASLTTTQPQAAVSREFIDNANAASDFNELIALTPGVSISGTGNGQGLGETKAVIRGFQDGEYNVTYDSIPFADTNNPTHHSTAFFPSNTIETVVVDRGPGNASQLGQATYGGNINMYSRAVSSQMGGQAEALLGNWNTFIGRFELQSGAVEKLGGAKFVLAGQYLRSDGALTYSPVNSKNLFFKTVVPIGQHNTLTLMSTWNRNFYYQSDVLKGATCNNGSTSATLKANNCAASSNIGQYGLNYGLSNDPTQQDYWKYNRTDKTTDFSYIRLQSQLGSGFSMDNRAYMYGYTNNTMSGNTKTVVTGFSGSGTSTDPYVAVKDKTGQIPGYNKLNKYRVLGYIGQVDYEFKYGKVKVGGWFEHSNSWRHTWDFSWSTGLPSYDQNANLGTSATSMYPSTSLAAIKYEQNSSWDQFQLFGEFEMRPTSTLSITPGIKYVNFTRGVNALVNADANRSPANNSATWTKTLPFATINWQPVQNLSFYGQYAQGMYVPDLSSFYTPTTGTGSTDQQNTALAAVKPQTSTNYQIGSVWHGRKISVDLDGYIINVNNKIASDTSVNAISGALVNIGTVHYKGVEGSVAFMPVEGLTLFTNGSYNYAQSGTTFAQIAKAPFTTAAVGMIYKHNGLRVSYSQKYTGTQYATEATSKYITASGVRLYRLSPYSTGEFAISQEIGRNLRLGATVSNVFNSRAITSISNGTYGVSDQFSFLPPRSFMVDARVKY
ncbi:MAG TPA: TonB-dependent receptor [Novosphingobium sp.]|nr:TonB-dependent receptor [Novosphingobium sp.]